MVATVYNQLSKYKYNLFPYSVANRAPLLPHAARRKHPPSLTSGARAGNPEGCRHRCCTRQLRGSGKPCPTKEQNSGTSHTPPCKCLSYVYAHCLMYMVLCPGHALFVGSPMYMRTIPCIWSYAMDMRYSPQCHRPTTPARNKRTLGWRSADRLTQRRRLRCARLRLQPWAAGCQTRCGGKGAKPPLSCPRSMAPAYARNRPLRNGATRQSMVSRPGSP